MVSCTIRAATGAHFLCENAFSRVDRGAGVPAVTRLPYFPADARAVLSKFTVIACVGARVPVAMFGDADGVSELVDVSSQRVVTVDPANAVEMLCRIAKRVGAKKTLSTVV